MKHSKAEENAAAVSNHITYAKVLLEKLLYTGPGPNSLLGTG